MKFAKSVGVATFCAMLGVTAVNAAEHKCDYFTVDMPAGWVLQGEQSGQNGAYIAMFLNQQNGTVITATFIKNGMDAKATAEGTAQNMKAQGVDVNALEQESNYYTFTYAQKGLQGEQYFCDDGDLVSVCNIIGPDKDGARDLISAMESDYSDLIPEF